MYIKVKPVYIVGIDSETLEKDSTFPDSYAFYIELSDEPNHLWQQFLSGWNNALSVMKMRIDVVGNKLRVVFTYSNDVQGCAKYAAQIVKMVNKRVEEHNRKIEFQEKKAGAKQQTNQEKEEEILKKLRELREL